MNSHGNHKVFAVSPAGFAELALEIFRFQYAGNAVYRDYVNALQVNVSAVRSVVQIPFLPIRFFKTHRVQTGAAETAIVFESSGTTGTVPSRHFVSDAGLYRESFTRGFESFYGSAAGWCIIGLLPSYLERQHSSLVYMADDLVRQSGHADSGFYLYEQEQLAALLNRLERAGQKTLLIGVTFALLDFAEHCPMPLKHTVIMETGGMKGRREELVRQEVHDILQQAFHTPVIHSEYGMTELLSQAYSAGEGLFRCPPWMKVLVRDDEDPLSVYEGPGSGAINIIDLANIHSCSFIATEDAGRVFPDGSFHVFGRLDHSDLRGCSLLVV
ncbi:MAG: acyl transferase [Chitinophagaceae bacterium]